MNKNSYVDEYHNIILGGKKLKFYNKPIGKGSFSKVFYAINLDKGIKYAIKRLDISKIDRKMIKRIECEIDIMKVMDHPNIVKCYDVVTTERYIYLFLEYCDKGTISDYIKKIDLSEEEIRQYIFQLKEGLSYLRLKKIMHRDLKTTNILLFSNDDTHILKIADFGFAKYYDDKNDHELEHTICGTPLYMAPEIILSKKYSSKSDLWSIGVIIYEMIYHNYPYMANNIIDLLKKIQCEEIIYDSKNISAECLDLIKSLLVVYPEKRISWANFVSHVWFSVVKLECGKMHARELLFQSLYDKSAINFEVFTNKDGYITATKPIDIIKRVALKPFSLNENYLPIYEEYEYENKDKTDSYTDNLIDYLSLSVKKICIISYKSIKNIFSNKNSL